MNQSCDIRNIILESHNNSFGIWESTSKVLTKNTRPKKSSGSTWYSTSNTIWINSFLQIGVMDVITSPLLDVASISLFQYKWKAMHVIGSPTSLICDKKKPMILWQREHTKGLFYSQNNKIVWLTNMADTFFWEIPEMRKGLWAFFSRLCFSDADWLGKQALVTWTISWQTTYW